MRRAVLPAPGHVCFFIGPYGPHGAAVFLVDVSQLQKLHHWCDALSFSLISSLEPSSLIFQSAWQGGVDVGVDADAVRTQVRVAKDGAAAAPPLARPPSR